MAEDFPLTKLGDVATVRSGFSFKSSDWRSEGVPVVKIANVKDGSLRMEDCSRVGPEVASTATEFELRAGDILIAMTGYIGDVALVRERDLPALLNQRVGRFTLNRPAKVDQSFLFHLLRWRDIRDEIERAGYGSAQQNVSPTLIQSVRVPLPPLAEQRAIARILGSLDDKIELNRRMNQTLEELARALFKSWFVDFDPVTARAAGRRPFGLSDELAALFPDRFVESELGAIPEGWDVQPVGGHMINFDSKRVPVSGAERAKRKGPYPYYGAASVMDSIDDYLFDGVYLLLGEDGSVAKDDGTAVTQYVWGKFWVNNHAHVLQGRLPVCTEHLWSYFQAQDVASIVTGAVQPKISQRNMNSLPFVFPGRHVCDAFSRALAPWFAMLRGNTDQNAALSKLRENLLPKLLSGEIRLRHTEQVVEEAVA